jgi:hypothetical protein
LRHNNSHSKDSFNDETNSSPPPPLLTSTRQQLEEDCRPDHTAEERRGALRYLDRRQRQRRWRGERWGKWSRKITLLCCVWCGVLCVLCCVWCAVCAVLCVVCCVWCAVLCVVCCVCCAVCAVCGVLVVCCVWCVGGRLMRTLLSFFLFQGTGHSRASFLVVLGRS